jgi:hypothetical protein
MNSPARRKFSAEEKAEAQRLKSAWSHYKYMRQVQGSPVTQQWLAEKCGWSGQSAVSQFLNATTPLNLDALIKICMAIDEEPEKISPRLTFYAQPEMAQYKDLKPRQERAITTHHLPPMPATGAPPLLSWQSLAATDSAMVDATIRLPCPAPHSARTFVLEIKDSANSAAALPSFPQYALIFVDPDAAPRSERGVVMTPPGYSEPILRWVVSEGGKTYIRALNPNHPDAPLHELPAGTTIHGTVVAKVEML